MSSTSSVLLGKTPRIINNVEKLALLALLHDKTDKMLEWLIRKLIIILSDCRNWGEQHEVMNKYYLVISEYKRKEYM